MPCHQIVKLTKFEQFHSIIRLRGLAELARMSHPCKSYAVEMTGFAAARKRFACLELQ